MDINSFALGYSAGKKKGGGGAELNIAYGDTPPEDTSKLWVKTSEPSGVVKHLLTAKAPDGYLDAQDTSFSTSLPSAKAGMGYAVVGSKLYMFGGGTDQYGGTEIICYDFEANSFRTLEEALEEACYNICCAAVGTKIYLFGGSYTNGWRTKAYCFDTETEQLAPLSVTTNKNGMCCAAVGTRIYLFGGSAYTSQTTRYKEIYCYYTEEDRLAIVSALPVGLTRIGCAAVGTKIYLFGGEPQYAQYVNTIYCFDTETSRVDEISTDLVEGSFSLSCVTVGSNIYITGGSIDDSTYANNKCYIFDTLTNRISLANFSTISNSCYSAFVLYDGALYAFGGCQRLSSYAPQTCYTTARKFELAKPVPLPKDSIMITVHVTASTGFVKLIDSDSLEMNIGVSEVHTVNDASMFERVESAFYKNGAWATI